MVQLFIQGYIKYIVTIAPGLFLSFLLLYKIENDFLSFLLIILLNAIVTCISTVYIVMSKQDRKKIYQFINNKLLRR